MLGFLIFKNENNGGNKEKNGEKNKKAQNKCHSKTCM